MKKLGLKTLLAVILSAGLVGCGPQRRCNFEAGTKVMINERMEATFLKGSSNCKVMFDNGATEWFSADLIRLAR